jgi:hypothetical protein
MQLVISLQCVQFSIWIQNYVNILNLSNCHKDALEMEFEGLPILKLDNTLRRVIGQTRQTGEMATSKQWTSNWVGHSPVLTNCQIVVPAALAP